jgi:hypothetical protein
LLREGEQHERAEHGAALLAALIPANAAAEAAQREKQETGLRKRLRQIDASENAQAREIEALAHVKDPHSRAVTAMRTRHLARFTELEDDRAQADAQLAALAKTTRDTGDPSLLDRLPMLGDLITEAPIRLQRRLYEAFDLQLLYNKHLHQVTIWATITPTTPGTLAAIINDSDDGHPAARNPPADPATATTHPEFSDPLPAPIRRGSSVIMARGGGRSALGVALCGSRCAGSPTTGRGVREPGGAFGAVSAFPGSTRSLLGGPGLSPPR